MSSSGHGQSVCKTPADADASWKIAQEGGRAGGGEVIVEGFVKFDYEITLLTVRHSGGTTFLNPIGHHQVDGDYRESWLMPRRVTYPRPLKGRGNVMLAFAPAVVRYISHFAFTVSPSS